MTLKTLKRNRKRLYLLYIFRSTFFRPDKDSPPTPDKDEIYKCVEFREILESSLKLLERGKAIMTEIYDMNSIELEPGADF